ncbi:MAG TPA: sulfate adenylyltransferase subunit CysN, partial [Wenzhouxiangella sp.]
MSTEPLEIESVLANHASKDLLRLITCGSVDDGKSTLIGRLLFDSKQIFEDQLASVERDSKKWGTTGDQADLALLVDGLQSEREQGITIDVAYRFFSTPSRKYIIADTPGHEQYTRNMATGASTADLAIILIDARKGVQTQTQRHSFIASLLGIRQIIVAVNKMDLVGYSEDAFRAIESDYRDFAQGLGFQSIEVLPVSALEGDGVIHASTKMLWFGGRTLMDCLETATPGSMGHPVQAGEVERGFRLPIQYVNRLNSDFRGFSGTVASGEIAVGDQIRVLPSNKESTITGLITQSGEVNTASAGDALTMTLATEIDISRGDVVIRAKDSEAPFVLDALEADVVWMSEQRLLTGRQYDIKLATQTVGASVESLSYQYNINTLEQRPAETLALNDIGRARWRLSRPVVFERYQDIPALGAFVIIDRVSNLTVGAGMVRAPISGILGEATNVVWHEHKISKEKRAEQKSQRPAVLWFTGLSGAGKSSVANALELALFQRGHHSYLLDGDNVRHGLNRDLGFSDEDRVENIRRIGEVAKLMADSGLVVLSAFISPFRADRDMVRSLMGEGEFVEIHIQASLEACESRDP